MPGGRHHGSTDKKSDKERSIEIACKRYSEAALKVLTDCLTDTEADIRWKIVAAKEVLDRAWGRPKQSVDASVKIEGADSLLAAIQAGKARVSARDDDSV